MISVFNRVPGFWPEYPGLLIFLKTETQDSHGFGVRFGQDGSLASVD